MKEVIFNDIQIGKNFKTSNGVTYRKISKTESIPLKRIDGSNIFFGLQTTFFYNSNLKLKLTN